MTEEGSYEAWYRSIPWDSLTIRDFEMLTTEMARQSRTIAETYWSSAGLEALDVHQTSGFPQFSELPRDLRGRIYSSFLVGQLSADLLGKPVDDVSITPRSNRPTSDFDHAVFAEGYRSAEAGRIIEILLQEVLKVSDIYIKRNAQSIGISYHDMAESLAVELFQGVPLESDYQLRYDLYEFALFFRRLITYSQGRRSKAGTGPSTPSRFTYELLTHVISACYDGKVPQTTAQRLKEYERVLQQLEKYRQDYEIGQAFERDELPHTNKGLMSRQPDEGAPPKEIGKK